MRSERLTPFEEAYFPICDGGMTISIQEKWTGEEPHSFMNAADTLTERPADPHKTFALQGSMSSFGSSINVEIPLGSQTVVRWLRDALDRTLTAMDPDQKWRGEFAFGPQGEEETEPTLSYRNGQKVERPIVKREAQKVMTAKGSAQ